MSLPLHPYLPLEAVHDALGVHGPVLHYGDSVEGRPLVGVEVGTGERLLLLTAGLHGLEYIGVQTALTVLAAGPIPGARLLVLPVLNPDGYAQTWAASGNAPIAALRKNTRGVDLNRNFPLPWGARPTRVPFAGADTPESATYRGPHPLSEPETARLAELIHDRRPHAAVGLHSFMGTQITARVWHRKDWATYASLSRSFRAGQGGWLGYPRLASPIGDVFTGELEDWLHHVHRCWAVCVECFSVAESLAQGLRAESAFWRFNPKDPAQVAERDARGVRAWLQHALELPRPPERQGAGTVSLQWQGGAEPPPDMVD